MKPSLFDLINTSAPALILRTNANNIINQALCEVGREGWLNHSTMHRTIYFMVDNQFNPGIREDLLLKFGLDTVEQLEQLAIISNNSDSSRSIG